MRLLSTKMAQYIASMPPLWVEGQVVQLVRRPGTTVAYLTLRDTDVDFSLSLTASTRGAFRRAFAARRCLVPADGFYEWQGPKGTKDRQPFHLRLKGGVLFGFAGLWEPGAEGQPGTLAVLTTEPNAVVEPIHDRMPVILAPADYARWLDPRTPQSALRPLLGPYPAAAMEAFTVGTAVNRASLDDPSCRAPAPPEAVQGRLI